MGGDACSKRLFSDGWRLQTERRPRLTSDLLLQTEDDGDGLVQDQQLGLRFVAFQVHLAHPAQLLERLVDVPHAQALASVVRHSPFPLPFHLLLRGQVLVVVVATVTNGRRRRA